MTSQAHEFQYYFDEMKSIWGEMSEGRRIIPFCTPVIRNPKFLVISTNHSEHFAYKDPARSDEISDAFAMKIPTDCNSYIHHDHGFARGLQNLAGSAQAKYPEFKISQEWVGTNRCAIQTPDGGLDYLSGNPRFLDCQKRMDKLLKKFIADIKPKNVILSGLHASKLYYLGDLQHMHCKKVLFGKGSSETFNLIPLWNASYFPNARKSSERLLQAIEDGFCKF